MRGAMSLTTTAEYTRDKMLAVMTAENRLLELRLARERLEQGENSLPCEQGGVTSSAYRQSSRLRIRSSGASRCACSRPRTDGSPRMLAELMTVLPTNQ